MAHVATSYCLVYTVAQPRRSMKTSSVAAAVGRTLTFGEAKMAAATQPESKRTFVKGNTFDF